MNRIATPLNIAVRWNAAVRHNGVTIKRLVLRFGARNYASAIDMYLSGKIVDRAAPALERGADSVREALAESDGAVYSEDWADIGGLLIAGGRLRQLEDDIASGKILTVADFNAAFQAARWSQLKPWWAG